MTNQSEKPESKEEHRKDVCAISFIEDVLNSDIQIEGVAVDKEDAEQDQNRINEIRELTFSELFARSHVSVRLRNCFDQETKKGAFPFNTIGEYLNQGDIALYLLMEIPNLGKKSALELHSLIESVLGWKINFHQNNFVHAKQLTLADELEDKYPSVFEPLVNGYRHMPETDLLGCQKLEKQIQQLLRKPRDAEICQRRFQEETLESIAQLQQPVMTRERVRQIEAKYKGLVADIYTESWLTRVVQGLLAQQEEPDQLPSNEVLKKYHPKLEFALRQVFLPESYRKDSLTGQERHDLAEMFGLNGGIELINSQKWSLEKVIHEVKEFASEIGKPDLMPMQVEMRDRGRNDLRGVIGRFGGQSKVASLAGLIYQGQAVAEDGSRTYWTEERIGEFLREVAEKEGSPGVMPTQKQCRDHAPIPNTIIAVLVRGGQYGETRSWFEIATHYGLKYSSP